MLSKQALAEHTRTFAANAHVHARPEAVAAVKAAAALRTAKGEGTKATFRLAGALGNLRAALERQGLSPVRFSGAVIGGDGEVYSLESLAWERGLGVSRPECEDGVIEHIASPALPPGPEAPPSVIPSVLAYFIICGVVSGLVRTALS